MRLDGGSIFAKATAEAAVVNRWMLEGVFRSKMDAINLSVWDLPVWEELGDLASRDKTLRELLNVPLVSANVTSKKPTFPVVRRYIIKEYPLGDNTGKLVRIGVTGVLSDPEERIPRAEFEVDDPILAARRVIEEMEGKADYRILLTDMDFGGAMSLGVDLPKVDLIVVTHNYEALSEPELVGQTLAVITVNEGRVINEVRLGFDIKAGKIDLQARFVPLDSNVPDDPAMGELVRAAQAAVRQFRNEK